MIFAILFGVAAIIGILIWRGSGSILKAIIGAIVLPMVIVALIAILLH